MVKYNGREGAWISGIFLSIMQLRDLGLSSSDIAQVTRYGMMVLEGLPIASRIYNAFNSYFTEADLRPPPRFRSDLGIGQRMKMNSQKRLRPVNDSDVIDLTGNTSKAPKFPQLTLPTTSSTATSSSAAAAMRSAVSTRNMNTPARTTSAQPLKVIQTVAAPSAKKSYSRRRGNTGITFDLARIMYPVLNTSASRGNLLMGLDCKTTIQYTSSERPQFSFVSCGSAWDTSGSTSENQYLAVLTYLWGCGIGRGLNVTTGALEAKPYQEHYANEFVVNFGIYNQVGAEFMPIPKTSGVDNIFDQPNSGNNKSNAPYLEIYGRSWWGDQYHSNVTSTVIYPDFKFCAQGCAMREYKNSSQKFNTVPNALQSYAGLQGVLELDGFLQGNQMCMLAQMAYDNSTLGRRLENPTTFYVDKKWDSNFVRVFDNDAINDSAQAVWLNDTDNVYAEEASFWTGCHSVGGLDLPFMYDIKDTLHFSNAMDVPIIVNVEIFECKDNIERRTPLDSTEFHRYNEVADIMPQWQQSLNDKADNTANNNGFYGGMSGTLAPTAKAERIYDVGRTADGAKNVKKYWKCVGKKHFKLESLQEMSHTFHKYDVINMKNVVDKEGDGLDRGVIGSTLPVMSVDTPTTKFLSSNITPPDNKKIGTHTVITKEKLISTGTTYNATEIKTHVDHRIKKYVKGHSYKYIITWFGLKQMANDANGANPPEPYTDVAGDPLTHFPDSAYIRNGRAQLVVSRSLDAQMRVGPGVKKSLVQQQRFGPVGERVGVFNKDGTVDLDLVGNGFTRAAADEKQINPISRQAKETA